MTRHDACHVHVDLCVFDPADTDGDDSSGFKHGNCNDDDDDDDGNDEDDDVVRFKNIGDNTETVMTMIRILT